MLSSFLVFSPTFGVWLCLFPSNKAPTKQPVLFHVNQCAINVAALAIFAKLAVAAISNLAILISYCSIMLSVDSQCCPIFSHRMFVARHRLSQKPEHLLLYLFLSTSLLFLISSCTLTCHLIISQFPRPLNAILGTVQLLMADQSLPAHVREDLELIHSSSHMLLRLLSDLIDLVKHTG